MDYEAILNAARAQEELKEKTNYELSCLLLEIWAGMEICSLQAGVIEEVIERLRRPAYPPMP